MVSTEDEYKKNVHCLANDMGWRDLRWESSILTDDVLRGIPPLLKLREPTTQVFPPSLDDWNGLRYIIERFKANDIFLEIHTHYTGYQFKIHDAKLSSVIISDVLSLESLCMEMVGEALNVMEFRSIKGVSYDKQA